MENSSLSLLVASLVALGIGPFLFRLFATRQHFFRLVDGFIVVVISGIVILEVMPELIEHLPFLGTLLLMLGFAGPTILERLFHKAAHQVHRTALLVGVAGIIVHTFVDGMVLFELPASGGHLLGWGVILHRLPVGITIWWLLEPKYGRNIALTILGLMIIGTIAGFWLGLELMPVTAGEGGLWLKAFVAGAILHVVIHQPHMAEEARPTTGVMRWAEGVGNLLGIGILALLLYFNVHGEGGHSHGGLLTGETGMIFWGMALESAPALLLAYLFGGMISVFLPATSIRWMNKGPALGRSVKGMLVGLPLPICTCGVLPLYRSLIKKGAPATAAMAFLIATPELGLDALLISIPLLGGDMTIVRLVAAALIALLIGWFVGTWTEKNTTPVETPADTAEAKSEDSVSEKMRKGLREGFGGLVDDTAPWILVGLLVAAFAHPILSQGWIQSLPPVFEVMFFALLGLPIYVCASGATPIVAVLLINGVSPGAALAFLLTGPATNVSTFGILGQVHSRSVAILFGFSTMFIAVSIGILVNLLLPDLSLLTAADMDLEHAGAIKQISLILLLLIFLASLIRRGARKFVGEVTSGFKFTSTHNHTHESATVASSSCGDHCEHC